MSAWIPEPRSTALSVVELPCQVPDAPHGVERGLLLVGDHADGRGHRAQVRGAPAEGQVLGGVVEGLAGHGVRSGVLAQVFGQFRLEELDVFGAGFVRLDDAVRVQHDHMGDVAAPALEFLGHLEGEVAAERVAEQQAFTLGPLGFDEVGVADHLVGAGDVVEGDQPVLGQCGGESPVDESVAAHAAGSRTRSVPARC